MSLTENTNNKNIKQRENSWLKVWLHKSDYEGMNQRPRLKFSTTVRPEDEEDYERDSFRVMVNAVDRYQTEKKYKRSLNLDIGFESLKHFFLEKARQL